MANAATATFVRLPVAPARPVTPLPSPWSLRGLPTAPLQAVQGRPTAWGALAVGTVLRSVLVGGGLYVAGVREPKALALGSLAASATLTAVRIATHASKQSRTA